MMVIGANTPAMIKTMTTDVESKNFIATSIHPCAEGPRVGMTALSAGPCICQQADSSSHYTLDAISGNAHNSQKRAPPGRNLPGRRLLLFSSTGRAAPDTPGGVLYNCHKLCIIFRFDLRSSVTSRRP